MTRRGVPVRDAARLALGTLTVLRVHAPRAVDPQVASWAMTFAPVVGALLSLAAGAALWLLGWAPLGGDSPLHLVLGRGGSGPLTDPAVASVLVLGLLAALTRGIHLDGLADTADGLGSGLPSDQALEVMRRGDIGPFGVVVLVLLLVTQVVALAGLVAAGLGPAALVLALVVSRLALPLACSRGVPAARPDGLGRGVAGTVGRGQLVLAAAGAVVTVVVLASPAAPGLGFAVPSSTAWLSVVVRGAAVAILALLAAAVVVRRAVRRLGGVTGDVLGAAVEVAFTTALVALTFVV